jgi:predicted AlkP superfamily pyrophosphatase or phosphodiesterase
MYHRSAAFVAFCLLILNELAGAVSGQPAPAKPKLIIAIVIDQFRYDYLTRFRADYNGGLDFLLKNGANFINAYYEQVPTVTAVGHSIFMSGAMPAVSGIVGNSWFDREEDKVVTSVCDWHVQTVGAPQETQGSACTDSDPASPNRLLVTTLGDELRNAHEDSRVVGVSIKARGAILPSGHRALGAFWFEDKTGNFVTSSFYMNSLPVWAKAFNDQKLPDKYVEQEWPAFPEQSFKAVAGTPKYGRLSASPWGNELIESFAEEAIKGEKLGQQAGTDLITISFSSNDYVGHAVGPDAPEVQDMAKRVDQQIGKLFRLLDNTIGMKNVLVVLTADHGVAPVPSVSAERKIPGGYVLADPEDAVQSALTRKFGKGHWTLGGGGETTIYLDKTTVAKAKYADGRPVSQEDIDQTVVDSLLSIPQLHVARVYTRKQLLNGPSGDFIAQAETNGFFPRRSGDFFLVFEPNFVPGTSGTTHFSAYGYDRHVPVLFYGAGIKAGIFPERVRVNDIAPTLASVLEIEPPSGSCGRVLTEILEH